MDNEAVAKVFRETVVLFRTVGWGQGFTYERDDKYCALDGIQRTIFGARGRVRVADDAEMSLYKQVLTVLRTKLGINHPWNGPLAITNWNDQEGMTVDHVIEVFEQCAKEAATCA